MYLGKEINTSFLMKKIGLLIGCILLLGSCFSHKAEKIEGVYKYEKNGFTQLWIFTDGYTAQTTYQSDAYVKTYGGTYTMEKGQLRMKIEFDDKNPSKIGTIKTLDPRFKSGRNFEDNDGRIWIRQPSIPQALDGTWKITKRKVNGELLSIQHKGTRKTLKLLKDGYFQWIAIDPGKNKFFGTGGGHYTFKNGQYAEEIAFFQRDNNRIGDTLYFKGEIKDGEWHHSGKSSTGNPIYEVWEKIN